VHTVRVTDTHLWDVRDYRRLSDDKGGSSIADQGTENAELCAERGWTMGPSYVDPDNSAGPTARKRRDDYDQLIHDLRNDGFRARILQMWEGSRGSRVATQWSELIVNCKAANIQIFITSYGNAGRLYDLSEWEDEKALLQDAINYQDEWHKIQKRTKRYNKIQGKTGRPHGTVPFGFVSRFSEKDGTLDNWYPDTTPVVGEWTPVQIVNDLFSMVAHGYTLTAIQSSFDRRGFIDKRGNGFHRNRLRWMALAYSYIGIREHHGELIDGSWDSILVDPEIFYVVRARLKDPRRTTTRPGAARHLLTGTLVCGICRGRTEVCLNTSRTGNPFIRCRNGHASVIVSRVDDFVIDTMLKNLARPDVYESLVSRPDDSPMIRETREALSKARAGKVENEAAARMTTSGAALVMLGEANDRLDNEILKLETRERELTLSPSVANFLSSGEDLHKTWSRMTLSAKRDLISDVLTPEYVGTPMLIPGHQAVPIKDRIAWKRIKE
jgi:site-specific DNA recombinase